MECSDWMYRSKKKEKQLIARREIKGLDERGEGQDVLSFGRRGISFASVRQVYCIIYPFLMTVRSHR